MSKSIKDISFNKLFNGMKVSDDKKELSELFIIGKSRTHNRNLVGLKFADGSIDTFWHDSMIKHYFAE